MLLFVQLPSGERLSLEVEPTETLARIKQLIGSYAIACFFLMHRSAQGAQPSY